MTNLCFEIDFSLNLEENQFDDWLNYFLSMIEEKDLFCGGGGHVENLIFIVFSKEKIITDEDRFSVKKWLEESEYTRDLKVSELKSIEEE